MNHALLLLLWLVVRVCLGVGVDVSGRSDLCHIYIFRHSRMHACVEFREKDGELG